jgi:hypothetical protein
MNVFIKSLFIDLYNRLDKMTIHLESLSMESRPAAEFKNLAVVEMTQLKKKIIDVMNSGILQDDFFTANTVIRYNSLNNEYLEIELFLYLPISKYDLRAEGYFEKIIDSVYREIKSSQLVPFISTISNSDAYYWAYSKYKMIAIPQGEERHLLNLSDLYHEIGHLTYLQNEAFLVNHHINFMRETFEKLLDIKKGRSKREYRKCVTEAITFWEDKWAEELACDLIGTFLVGPAYAWSNMKICAVSSGLNNIYSNSKIFRDHPPDEARMRCIFMMLELIGCADEVPIIKQVWERLLSVTHNDKPQHYDVIFSEELLRSITENVHKGCNSIRLASYPKQMTSNTRPISQIINEAWEMIRNKPLDFPRWEGEQIENLQSRVLF